MMTIDAKEISNIHVIGSSRNRVLIVKQRNSTSPLVVKSEDTVTVNPNKDVRGNVGAMLEFHGSLFSSLRALPFKTERLQEKEITALRSCSPNNVTGLNAGETWPALYESEIANSSTGRKSAVKISYIEQLANLGGMVKDDRQIGPLRTALESGNMDFMFQIGEIYAVDLFIGNHDRFNAKGFLEGPQNLFFSLKGGVLQATGIDTYDVFGMWSDLNKTIEDLELANRGSKWPGRVLAHGNVKDRDAKARMAVEEVLIFAYNLPGNWGSDSSRAVVACNISKSRKDKLVAQLHKGMSEAKSTLRKKYKLSDNMAGLSAGIRSRWSIIRG